MYIPHKNYRTCESYISEEHETDPTFSHFAIVLFSGDTEKETTFSGELIARTLLHDFGGFYAYSCDTVVDFMYEWTRFKQLHTHDFERIYTALYADYSPIENYDKFSVIDNEGSTGSDAENPVTVSMKQVTDDTVNSTGDAAYIPQGQTITTGKNEVNNTMTEHTHGNIGVTKATDMIFDEIKLRVQNNMVNTICNMFAEMELI